MRTFEKRPALRWLVPGAAVVVVLGAGSAFGAMSALAGDELPPRSAAQLLADVRAASVTGISGTVRQSADLGLPQLPFPAEAGSFSPASLLSGSHTLRVWYAGPDKARLALIGTLGEYDLIRNGADTWTWDSEKNEATHHRATGPTRPSAAPTLPGLPTTPQEAAEQALAAVEPTTRVTIDGPVTVAGRAAHELVLIPKDPASLVGSVRIAIDGTEHVPLRVRVFATGTTDPAVEVGFTSVNFTRPDDAQFAFTPPPGAKVTEATEAADEKAPGMFDGGGKDGMRVVGTGWTSVLVGKTPTAMFDNGGAGGSDGAGGSGADAEILARVLNTLPAVSGDWGSGRLLAGKLFSVLLTDDGRVLVGAVAPERLYAAAR